MDRSTWRMVHEILTLLINLPATLQGIASDLKAIRKTQADQAVTLEVIVTAVTPPLPVKFRVTLTSADNKEN